jgi:molybdenum cofactor synthesis domain-containing protein
VLLHRRRTGDAGRALQPGQIYNSNRYTLTGLLNGLGCELIDLGIVPDTLEATEAALAQAASLADVVITSGGVSVGEADYVKAAVEKLGRVEMWKVAMKPGKPLVYGRVNDADFIGLPGNPVSAFVTFCLFVRPFLLKRMGVADVLYRAFAVQADFAWTSRARGANSCARGCSQRQAGAVPQPELGRADLVRLGRRPGRSGRRPDHPAGRLGALHSLLGTAVMKLRVLYFARLRERFGVAEETLEFAGATAADLVAATAGARRRVGRGTGGRPRVPGRGQPGHRRARRGAAGPRRSRDLPAGDRRLER